MSITERDGTEGLPGESVERYRTLFEAVSDAIIVADPATMRFRFGNDRAAEMLGCSVEELNTLGVTDIHPADALPRIRNDFDRMVRDGSAAANDVPVLRRDGTVISVDIHGRLFTLDGQRLVMSVIRDMTAQRRVEAELRESELKYRDLVENAGEAVLIIGEDGVFQYANQRVASMAGYSPADLIGRAFLDHVYPADRNAMAERFRRRIGGDPLPPVECRVLHKAGGALWVQLSSASIRWQGRPAVLSFLTDVTERRKAEEELRSSEEKYRTLIENVGEVFFSVSRSGVVTYVSPAVEKVIGFRPEELVQSHFARLIHPDDLPALVAGFERTLAGAMEPHEYRLIGKQGEVRHILSSSRPYFEQGIPAGLAGVMIDITARKRAEEALKASEELYRSHFEQVADLVYMIDQDLVVRTVSPSLRDILGIEPSAVVGRSVDEIAPLAPDIAADVAGFCRRLLEGENLGILEYRLSDLRGTPKILEITSNRIVWGKGFAIAGIARDVTEQRRTSEEVRKSRAMLESIFSATPVGIGLAADRIQLEMNDSYCEMVGYTKDELIGADTRMLYPTDEDYASVETELYRKIGEAGTGSTETRWRRKDGRIIDVLIRGAALDPGDLSKGVAFTVMDITERLRTEELIRKRQQALQAIYDIATAKTVSLEEMCMQAAAALARLLAVGHVIIEQHQDSQGTVLARWADGTLYANEPADVAGTPREMVSRTGQPYRCTGDLAGSYPTDPYLVQYPGLVSYSGTPIKSNAGAVAGTLSVFEAVRRPLDDDDMHLLEIFARYLGYEMERQQIELKLRETGKVELLSAVASGIAHEVRNPLHAIQAISDALFQDLGDAPPYQEYIHHIRAQVSRLSELMNDLLELGKPLLRANLRTEPIHHLCAQAVELWTQSKSGAIREIVLDDRLEDGAREVRVDPAKIHQVLINLLDNAHQHSAEGSSVTVWLARETPGGVTVGVSDLGTGIPPAIIGRIFDPFFTTRKKGTGLGLSLCKHIVDTHGGSIRAANHSDRPGCTVEFTLPTVSDERI